MNINIFSKDFWKGDAPETQEDAPVEQESQIAPAANYMNAEGGGRGVVWAVFDGETNAGEMGPAKMYIKDFYTLRVRSKQLFVESPICQAIIGRFTGWVIGRNLRLCLTCPQ
jgi:hypothetical protein